MNRSKNSPPSPFAINASQNDLIEFYEGSIADPKRHQVEEFLLESQIGLLEFFSIKRDRELPVDISPSARPSKNLKDLLDQNFLLQQPLPTSKKWLASAAVILLLLGGTYLAQNGLFETFQTEETPILSVDTAGDVHAETAFM